MRILFVPFAAVEELPGVLTRAIAREIAARVGRATEAEVGFRPFMHMLDGKRYFGVYGKRWSPEDLARLWGGEPAPDLLVHGDLRAGDPFSLTIEVLRVPDLNRIAEETFEAAAFRGFDAIEQAARFVCETAELSADPKLLADFPARTFEGYLSLLEGREGRAGLDAWGEPGDPGEVFDPYFRALNREPGMKAAKTEISLLAASAALSGSVPLDAAEEALDKLLAADRKQWRAWAAIAQVNLARGEEQKAVDAFQKALELEPGRASLRYDLGMTLLRQGRTGRAAKVLESVKSDAHLGAEAHLELGSIRAAKKDMDGAVDLWRRSIELDPERALAYANLGNALSARGEFEEAEETFRKGLAASRPSWALHLAWGTYQAEQDRYPDAIAELKNVLRLRPDVPEAHLHLGRCYAAEGRKQPALYHLRKALRGPESVAEEAGRIVSDLSAPEHEEKLRETLDEAVSRSTEEQVGLLKELLKAEPGFADARIRLGLALIVGGKGRAAEGHFRKVLKAHPDDPEAWSALATALRTRGRLKAAVDSHREAIERAPTHASYHLNLADTFLRMDRTREAAAEVDAARSLEPHHPLLPNFVIAVKLKLSESGRD